LTSGDPRALLFAQALDHASMQTTTTAERASLHICNVWMERFLVNREIPLQQLDRDAFLRASTLGATKP
jgi:hypothetical protein